MELVEKNHPTLTHKSIPKTLFKTSKYTYPQLPAKLLAILNESLSSNPDYQHRYFDDQAIIFFISERFPQYLAGYRSLKVGAYRADIFRLLILYEYGGIYNDIGHQYLAPLQTIVSDEDEFVIALDWVTGKSSNLEGPKINYLYNAFIASYPKHPLLLAMIEQVMDNVKKQRYGIDCLDITGPCAIGRAFQTFLGLQGFQDIRGQYTHNGYKLKILYYSSLQSPNYESEGYVVQYDKQGTESYCIQTKFPGYYSLLYPQNDEETTVDYNSQRYATCWNQRDVYYQVDGRERSFDWITYLAKNPDLKRAGIVSEERALRHWKRYGLRERREY